MGEAAELRLLVPGDEQRLFALLERYVDTSLFLFSNVERAGLVDRGEPLQGTYVARFDEAGAITAIAAHSWNGNVMLQGDAGLEEAAVRVAAASGRPIRGLIGPWSLVCRARKALGLEGSKASHDARELLFALSLQALTLPSMLERDALSVRPPTELELRETLLSWRVEYMVETLGAERTPDLENSALQNLAVACKEGLFWVLTHGGELVAMTAFNASARGIVQVGGVYTPPALRGRGYARAAVAGSLLRARENGATRSVLFTAEENQAARRCYTSLGYQVIGDFGLVLF
jgi:RimJ/RimL family protein N-acetyltransferase